MTTTEAAAWLAARGVPLQPGTIKRHCLRGVLPAVKVGSLRRGEWQISEAALVGWLAAHRGPGGPPGPRRRA